MISDFIMHLFVLYQPSDCKEQADDTHDVVPGIGFKGEEVRSDRHPHVAPGIEGNNSYTNQDDMQPQAVSFAGAAALLYQAGNDGNEYLREDPEFPHGAVVQLKAQEVQAHVEANDLSGNDFEHVLGRGSLPEVDILLIGTGSLEAEDLHPAPYRLTDG